MLFQTETETAVKRSITNSGISKAKQSSETTEKTAIQESSPRNCSIFDLKEWNVKVNLTVDAKPIFIVGQQKPKGVEFIWHLDASYPDCKGTVDVLSDGAVGSHLINTHQDFK